MNCPYCNHITTQHANVTGFKICNNHKVKVSFYPNLNWIFFMDGLHTIILYPNKTTLTLLDKTCNSYKEIISIPYIIDITPESFNSILDKLLKLKIFL